MHYPSSGRPFAACFPVKNSLCFDNPTMSGMSLYLASLQRRNADHEMPVSFGPESTCSLPGTYVSNPKESTRNPAHWRYFIIKYCLFSVDSNVELDTLDLFTTCRRRNLH